jgi:hypothetical protein
MEAVTVQGGGAGMSTSVNPMTNALIDPVTTTTIQDAVPVAAQIEPAHGVCEISRHFLAGHHLMQPNDVDRVCDQERRANKNGVVTGLIAPRSVSVLIGDSGIGKSPLAYQLGLCVAAGVPFLGMPTQEGLIVYADYENPIEESRELRDRQVGFLELPIAPDNFLLWTPDSGDSLDIEGICSDVKPAMFIIDSLRSHDPQFEKSENAGEAMKRLNTIARMYGTAILAIHHVRKPGEVGVPLLDSEDTGLMVWLKQAAGHSSIINQSHTRIAVDLPDGRKNLDAALVLRWHWRIKGETGPVYVERMSDDEGEPQGYRLATGVELLGDETQKDKFRMLPRQFAFKEAKQIYGRADDPTRKWLLKCASLGLLRQIRRGQYEKSGQPGN